jgi:hypothetical protein
MVGMPRSDKTGRWRGRELLAEWWRGREDVDEEEEETCRLEK